MPTTISWLLCSTTLVIVHPFFFLLLLFSSMIMRSASASATMETHHKLTSRILSLSPASLSFGKPGLISTLVTRLGALPCSLALSQYPCVREFQWSPDAGRTDSGMGDLVLSNEQGDKFAVVQVKHIDWLSAGRTACATRTQHKRSVKEQAGRYLLAWKKSHPDVLPENVLGLAVFNSRAQGRVTELIYGLNQDGKKVFLTSQHEDVDAAIPSTATTTSTNPEEQKEIVTTWSVTAMDAAGRGVFAPVTAATIAPTVNQSSSDIKSDDSGQEQQQPHNEELKVATPAATTIATTDQDEQKSLMTAVAGLRVLTVNESKSDVKCDDDSVQEKHARLWKRICSDAEAADARAETKVTCQLVAQLSAGILSSDLRVSHYPYVCDYEWMIVPGKSQHGVGDLVLTDGQGQFAVVEVKHLDYEASGATACVKRTKHRKKVGEQGSHYVVKWKALHPEVLATRVIGISICNTRDGQSFEELEYHF